jgi:hypothetical protein
MTADPRPPRDDVARARRLARWLDDRFLDPILGFLFPGVGDLLGSAAGLYALSVAVRRRLPPVVIARMLLNLAIDAALGAVPVQGDLFDVFFRAHRRNLRLLESRTATGRATVTDWVLVVGALLLFLAALALPERTRADMDHTIDALRDRFTFDSILRIGLDRRGGPNVFLRNLGATVRDNPVPFLLSGVGIAWLALSRPHDPDAPPLLRARALLVLRGAGVLRPRVLRAREGPPRSREGASGRDRGARGGAGEGPCGPRAGAGRGAGRTGPGAGSRARRAGRRPERSGA